MGFFIPMGMYWDNRVDISELIGKTITEIEGCHAYSDTIKFRCSDGSEYVMYHNQDCCEDVSVEEVFGDVRNLIGFPIVMAECVAETGNPKDIYDDSCTWTFYKLATIMGYVTIRWYGSSNGCYSEEVDLVRVKEPAKVEE